MSQIYEMNSRRLRLSASVLAIVAAVAGSASAQTTVLTQGQYYDLNTATDTAVEVPTGMIAYYNSGVGWALPGGATLLNYSSWMSSESSASFNWWDTCCRFNAPVIVVDSGATLRFVGNTSVPYSWYTSGATDMQSMIQATGDVVFESTGGNELEIIGNNKFLGNATLLDGAIVQMGWDWSAINATTTFGPNTHFDLQGASTLKINQNGTGIFSGTISSSSAAVFEVKSGTLVMNGQSPAFTGTVNIGEGGDSGTLMIGDTTHSSAVLGATTKVANINVTTSSSTLSGYGTINGTVHNSGIVRPGGTSGVDGSLTINGNYTQAATGQLIVSISPTSSSKLVVNGNATLAGSLVIKIADGTYGNGVYPILTATSVTGSFTGGTSTVGSVSGAIVGVLGTSTGYSIVTEKGSNAQVAGHLVYANRNALTQFVDSLYDEMAIAPESGQKVNVWLTPIGEIENLGRDGLGYGQTTYGVSVGAEHRFGWHNAVVGAAFSYRRGNMTVKDDPATASSNGYDYAAYGGININHVRIDGSVFYNRYDAKTKRPMGAFGTSAADEGGWAWGLSGQISRDLFGGLVTPYIRGTFARVHQKAATEAGSTQYDLTYDLIHANTEETDFGLRVHVLRPQPERNIKLDVDVALRHDFSDPGETVSGGFANMEGSPFTNYWRGDSQNAVRGGLNLASQITDQLEVFGRLDGTFTLYRRAGELSIGAKYRF